MSQESISTPNQNNPRANVHNRIEKQIFTQSLNNLLLTKQIISNIFNNF